MDDDDEDYDRLWEQEHALRQTSIQKFTINDFNLTKVLGKGSFGKVSSKSSAATILKYSVHFRECDNK